MISYIVYTKPGCPACTRAKDLLRLKNFPFEERVIDVGQGNSDPTHDLVPMAEFKAAYPLVRTLPYIILGAEAIGGFNELKARIG